MTLCIGIRGVGAELDELLGSELVVSESGKYKMTRSQALEVGRNGTIR